MKAVYTLLSLAILVGCSEQTSKVSVVEDFWAAVSTQDLEAAKLVISNPEQAQFLEGLKGKLDRDNYEILAPTEDGVNVVFYSECFTDVAHPTFITEVGGEPKVDLQRTMMASFKATAQRQRTKQYCHDFADQPMQGKINGETWKAHHLNRAVYDFGTKKSEEMKIVSEPCQDEWCNGLNSPALLINLDLSGSGGNFDSQNNITVFTPPGSNEVISEGSYRVSSTTEGKTKLEISFQEDESNTVSGFIHY